MNKKIVIPIAVVLGVVAIYFTASSLMHRDSHHEVKANSIALEKRTIKCQADSWTGYIPFRQDSKFVAALTGQKFSDDTRLHANAFDFAKALQTQGYTYSYETQTDQAVRADNMTAGSINCMATTLGQVLKHAPQGQIVAMIDASNHADALFLNTKKHPYLKSKDDLPRLVREFKAQNKKPSLYFSGDSPSEEGLYLWASKFSGQLKLTDFDLRPVADSPHVYEKLKSNDADVAILWEPDTTDAVNHGYTIAMSSKDVPELILDVVVASDREIQENPVAVQAVVDNYYRSREWDKSHARDFLAAVALDGADDKGNPMALGDAQNVLNGIILYDAKQADAFINQQVKPFDMTKAAAAEQKIFVILKLLNPSLTERHVFNGTFVHQAVIDLGLGQ